MVHYHNSVLDIHSPDVVEVAKILELNPILLFFSGCGSRDLVYTKCYFIKLDLNDA